MINSLDIRVERLNFYFSVKWIQQKLQEELRTALRIQRKPFPTLAKSHLVSKGFRGGVLRCNLARMTSTNREVYLR